MSLGIHVVDNKIVVRRAGIGDGIALGYEDAPCCCEEEEEIPTPFGACNLCRVMGLRGQYYNNITMTGTPVLTRDDEQIDFTWTGSPGTGVNDDNFSVRWTGKIQAGFSSGTYTFYTTSANGVKLTVNGSVVINQMTTHAETVHSGTISLTENVVYDITLEYYNDTGTGRILLEWSYTGQPQETVPARNLGTLDTNSLLGGLTAEIFDDITLTVPNGPPSTDSTGSIDYTWTGAAFDSFFGLTDNYSVRWEGYFYAPTVDTYPSRDDDYTFYVKSANGVRLYINDELVVDNWTAHAETDDTGVATLRAGLFYPIMLEFFHTTGTARIKLEYSYTGQVKTLLTGLVRGAEFFSPGQYTVTVEGATMCPTSDCFELSGSPAKITGGTINGTFCVTQDGPGNCVFGYSESPGTTVAGNIYSVAGCSGVTTPLEFRITHSRQGVVGLSSLDITLGNIGLFNDAEPTIDCEEELTYISSHVTCTLGAGGLQPIRATGGIAVVTPGAC